MPSFEQDHEYLLELSNIFEPTSQYSLDYTYILIDSEISKYEPWEEFSDGPIPSAAQINCTPENWYTQYWFKCALNNRSSDLDGMNSGKSATTRSMITKQSTLDTF